MPPEDGFTPAASESHMHDEMAMISGLRQHDPQVFAEFFDQYADRVYRLALGMLGNVSDAEEVTQATFLSALEFIAAFEPHARVSTWLYRIAHNHALMLLRKRHPSEPLPDESMGMPVPEALVDWSALPEERLLSEEAQETLLAAISELPEGLRAAFVLRDIEQLSTAECAHVQGITESSCKVRLHRARLLLRERLTVYFGEWVRETRKQPQP